MKAIEILFEKIIELSNELETNITNSQKVDIVNAIKQLTECVQSIASLGLSECATKEYI